MERCASAASRLYDAITSDREAKCIAALSVLGARQYGPPMRQDPNLPLYVRCAICDYDGRASLCKPWKGGYIQERYYAPGPACEACHPHLWKVESKTNEH